VQIAIILGLDALLSFVMTNLVGPAAFKSGAAPCQFATHNLPALLFRAPFYLLRFYIGFAALLLRKQPNWFLWGPLAGFVLTVPLGFLSALPDCPKSEPWANIIAGILQGAILGWVAVRLSRPSHAPLPQ
jgi:hypothetical protein